MDKYQKYILSIFDDTDDESIFSCHHIIGDKMHEIYKGYYSFNPKNDSFNVAQDEDITKTKYIVKIPFGEDYEMPIEKVFVHKANGFEEIKYEYNCFQIVLDFEDRIDSIKLVFKNHLADDYVFSVTYKEADKDRYYVKQEQKRKDNLLKNAGIKVATGASLVNIYFQPCCEKYDHTEISLYIPQDFERAPGPYGPYDKPSTWSIIKKCKVPSEDYFSSIDGLAYGEYSIVMRQYDKDDNILLETDHISFKLVKERQHTILDCQNVI